MQTYLECYPCIIRQSIEAARMAGANHAQERAVVMQTMQALQHMPEEATPPEIGTQVHQLVREVTGNDDPYLQVKQEATQKALAMLPRLMSLVDESADPLDTALRLSIVGNIIDFGPNLIYDLWEEVERVLAQDLAIDDTADLEAELSCAESVLFLGDNAGETVFDRLLIERLGIPVTYVVRGGPVLNDATMDDAIAAGIDCVADVVDNGARAAGTILSMCSDEFLELFRSADLIIAKGMGNYETLSGESAPIFFLLQVKCPIIGQDVGAPAGSTIVKKGQFYSQE